MEKFDERGKPADETCYWKIFPVHLLGLARIGRIWFVQLFFFLEFSYLILWFQAKTFMFQLWLLFKTVGRERMETGMRVLTSVPPLRANVFLIGWNSPFPPAVERTLRLISWLYLTGMEWKERAYEHVFKEGELQAWLANGASELTAF